jgi:hypothetical protein
MVYDIHIKDVKDESLTNVTIRTIGKDNTRAYYKYIKAIILAKDVNCLVSINIKPIIDIDPKNYDNVIIVYPRLLYIETATDEPALFIDTSYILTLENMLEDLVLDYSNIKCIVDKECPITLSKGNGYASYKLHADYENELTGEKKKDVYINDYILDNECLEMIASPETVITDDLIHVAWQVTEDLLPY